MKKSSSKHSLVLISTVTALFVGLINTTSALIAYHSFIPKRAQGSAATFIKDADAPASAIVVSSSTNVSTLPQSNSQSGSVRPASGSASQAQPVATTPGTTTKPAARYCSGVNPDLEDGVCEAIKSIAADPTASNPHLSKKAKDSLSLMPAVTGLTMDESSWVRASANSGTITVTADTREYGSVKLKIFLDKINGIWVLSDGQLV